MKYDAFNRFCGAFPGATYVVQWGGSHVWKVGDKVFAIGGWDEKAPAFAFKVSPVAFEVLKEQPGLRPAPHLASRGMSWIQQFSKPGLSDKDLKAYLRASYAIIAAGLPKKKRTALGL